jgi:hypothetical protein
MQKNQLSRRVALVRTDISEERVASPGATSQKTAYIIVASVKTSNLI